MSTSGATPLIAAKLPVVALVIFLFFSSPLSISPSLASTVVTHLPGFKGPLPFYMETGYVNVDEENGSEYFYYFIKSKGDPQVDPVVLWQTGGPRCSSLGGLLYEIGPLRLVSAEYNGSIPELVYHPYEWTKFASIIFLDSPVGSGFSFSTRPEGYHEGDVSWSKHAHKFLLEWFKDHPMFLKNPLYLAGDSYAGKIIPIVAHEISNGLEHRIKPVLNLKGYIIGNPVTGSKFDVNSRIPFAHGHGIISTQFFEETKVWCDGQDYLEPSTAECADYMDAFDKITSEIDLQYILDPLCPHTLPPLPERSVRGSKMSIMDNQHLELFDPPEAPPLYCRSYAHFLTYYWANNADTRRALNIKKGTVLEWKQCHGANFRYKYDIENSIEYHLNLTTNGYRALVFSGDHDMLIPFLGTEGWIRSLNFSVVNEWRSWHVHGQVAGYTIVYSNNLTFATVKNSGHEAPEYTPVECFAMAERWIAHKML